MRDCFLIYFTGIDHMHKAKELVQLVVINSFTLNKIHLLKYSLNYKYISINKKNSIIEFCVN